VLLITLDPADVSQGGVSWLVQRGVACRALTPVSVQQFLTEQLAWPAVYVRDRIETILVDGRVVDDPAAAIVHDGSTLTLSAAMPGLVGATLRKGGFYAAMRAEISWNAERGPDLPPTPRDGLVRVKLFNLILREKGMGLFERGVVVGEAEAAQLLGDTWWADQGLAADALVEIQVGTGRATEDETDRP
jgi:hypothetical protein